MRHRLPKQAISPEKGKEEEQRAPKKEWPLEWPPLPFWDKGTTSYRNSSDLPGYKDAVGPLPQLGV